MAKIRKGFVSNSSSSSFVIDGDKFDSTTIRNYIGQLLNAHNIVEEENLEVEDICEIYGEDSPIDFNNKLIESGYDDYYPLIKFDGPVVIVDSVGDNSIPWSVQEALEDISIRRYHWG